MRLLPIVVLAAWGSFAAQGAFAVEAASPVAPAMRLLESGRVPDERVGTLIELICRRGTADDLAHIYKQAVDPDGFRGAVRLQALQGLTEAAHTRKLRPSGDLSGLGRLVRADAQEVDEPTRLAAVRLTGLWKVEPLATPLEEIAVAPGSAPSLRQAAVEALVALGGDQSRAAIQKLLQKDQPHVIRSLGVAALAAADLDEAARRAAEVLRDSGENDDPGALIDPFLKRKEGPERLGAALAAASPPADVAKLALRHLYSIGRSDPALVAPLSDAAGITAEVQPPTAEELRQLVAEVAASGDPARGEMVFRRSDLSCLKCHAVSGAGGDVGPDLSSVGSNSPVDYLIQAVLVPDLAIKEQYQTVQVVTTGGQVFQGIAVDKDDQRLVIKDASGEETAVPVADIDEQFEGKSLMPKGLANFMTRAELVDLISFLSQLGKSGEYAIRSSPTIQRWRVLREFPEHLQQVAASDAVDEDLRQLGDDWWLPAYATVAGWLLLDELTAVTGQQVLYLYSEVEMTEPGAVVVKFDSPQGVTLWAGEQVVAGQESVPIELSAGRHRLLFRVDTAGRDPSRLRVEVARAPGSSAEYVVVGGR